MTVYGLNAPQYATHYTLVDGVATYYYIDNIICKYVFNEWVEMDSEGVIEGLVEI